MAADLTQQELAERACLESALRQVEACGAVTSRAGIYTSLAWLYSATGRYQEQLTACEQAVALARAADDVPALVEAAQCFGWALLLVGRVADALAETEQVIVLAETVGNHYARNRALEVAAIVHEHRGDFNRAKQYRAHALELVQRLDAAGPVAFLLSAYGRLLFLAGDWKGARSSLEQTVSVGRGVVAARWRMYPLLELGRLRLAEGQRDEACALLDESLAISESHGELVAVRHAQRVRAECGLLQGQPAAARARLTPLLHGPTLEEWGLNFVAPILAWAHLEEGQISKATAVLAQAMATARSRADRLTLVDLLRVQAMVATWQRCWAEAEQALDEGLSLARAMPYPYADARLLHVYGEIHAQKGDPGQARERLEAALTIFRRLGARKDAERSEQALAELHSDD